MNETVCTYPDRDERLVAYLYDDIDSAERSSFGLHLSSCRQCQEDLTALGGVRTTLSAWAPPEPSFASRKPRAASREMVARRAGVGASGGRAVRPGSLGDRGEP